MEKAEYIAPRLVDGLRPRPGHIVEGLRPTTGADGLMALTTAGRPRLLPGSAGWTPLARTGQTRAAARERTLALLGGEAPVVQEARLSGTSLCLLRLSPDELFVMTSAGADIVSSDGIALKANPVNYEYPPIRLRAENGNVASATVLPRTLSKSYRDNRKLSAADRAALAGDLEEAYRSLCADAAAAGYFVQPVLARYRLLDSGGRVLFESPTVLLMPPEGTQCGDSVELSSADGQTVDSYTIQAKAWRPVIDIPAADSQCRAVAAVEISTSPQFHPYHPGRAATVNTTRTAAGVFARVSLPGAHWAISGVNDAAASSFVARAVARMDVFEHRIEYVNTPFGATARTLRPAVAASAEPGDDSRALEEAMRRPVARPARREALMAAPHTFSASCAATDGVSTAWGCITAHRYPGYPLQTFACASTDEAWHATMVVKFDGRKGVRRFEEHTGLCPAKLGPVLSYPAPDASEMTILLSKGGRLYKGVFALRPDESGLRAVYISPGLKPIELAQASTGQIVDIENADCAFHDAVAIAPVDNPLAILSSATMPGGTVRALQAMPGTGQSWEFGRSRFFAGTGAGIFSVVASSGGGKISTRIIDSRGIGRRSAMAATPEAVYALLTTPGADTSVPAAINATGKVRPIALPGPYSALAYDPEHSELWAFKANGTAAIFCLGHEAGMYSRYDVACTDTATTDGEAYGISPQGIVCLGMEDAAERNTVTYADTASPKSRRPFVLNAAVTDIRAIDSTMTMAFDAVSNNGTAARPYVRLRIKGDILSPVVARTAGAPARSIAARIAGSAGADFIFTGFRLYIS